MASAYLPVETILKVDESELLLGENIKIQQPVPGSPSKYVSIGTQCDWKLESPDSKSYNLIPINEKSNAKIAVVSPDSILLGEKNDDDVSMVIKGWPSHSESSQSLEQKMLLPANFSQQFACNIQALPVDEKFFLQFDYKTRNKLKTKQRRMDPYYRSQERVRQRTVMRIKRQDPRFRAAEREKGRYRMRLKRLDPVFRSQERERQRERMKMKRSDPGFREREREQQKSRLHVKRLDPTFKVKDEELRLCIKQQQNTDSFSTIDVDKNRNSSRNPIFNLVAENQTSKHSPDPIDIENTIEMRNNQAVFPENINSRLLSLKPRESVLESFHFKKQHILNFNFYNTTKEQWASHDELCSKTVSDFNVSHETEAHKQESIQNDTNLLQRDLSTIQEKTADNEEIQSDAIINIKSEELSVLESQNQESSHEDSETVHRYSLTSCTGK